MSLSALDFAPGRFWSLWDLLKFHPTVWGLCLAYLQRDTTLFRLFPDDPQGLKGLKESLVHVETHMRECEASYVIKEQAKRLVEKANELEPLVLIGHCEALFNSIVLEFGRHMYLQIDASDRDVFGEDNHPFGENVENCFDESRNDIIAAARCLALGESNASVFHSMRVLEYGLRSLASELGILDFGLENWQNIIDRIEKEIRDQAKRPKSPEKLESLRHFSAAAVQFRYFKDAWRNHTSHSRSWYDELVAKSVFEHVRQFMQELATNISGKNN